MVCLGSSSRVQTRAAAKGVGRKQPDRLSCSMASPQHVAPAPAATPSPVRHCCYKVFLSQTDYSCLLSPSTASSPETPGTCQLEGNPRSGFPADTLPETGIQQDILLCWPWQRELHVWCGTPVGIAGLWPWGLPDCHSFMHLGSSTDTRQHHPPAPGLGREVSLSTGQRDWVLAAGEAGRWLAQP